MNNLYTIPASLPFADTLAEWVLKRHGDDPLALSRVTILLPSRRSCRGLRDAFLRASEGKPLLLPRMQPLGDRQGDADVSESGPAVEPSVYGFEYKRLSILAQLIKRYRQGIVGHKESLDNALHLAAALTALLDELEREEVSLDNLAALVPDAFSEHWQVTVEFLRILSQHWPAIAETENLTSPEALRSRAMKALALRWQRHPPSHPVIIAGTTGSIPATALLLKAVAGLAQGAVVLPALDMQADEAYFEAVHEGHPQWGMKQLLGKLGCGREAVEVIGAGGRKSATHHPEREALLREIMRPAGTVPQPPSMPYMQAALKHVRLVECAHMQEEAGVIALLLREALESPEKTAALVTHDRELARRVAAVCQRLGISIDDSAGLPLLQTPLLSFLRLIPEAAFNAATPVPLLSLLKHPLTHAGMPRMDVLEAARELEKRCLRGVRQNGGIGRLKMAFHQNINSCIRGTDGKGEEVTLLLDNLERFFAPWEKLNLQEDILFPRLLALHIECAEALGGETLWEGPEADAVKECLAETRAGCADMPVRPCDYAAVLDTLLAGKVFRPPYGAHPRLKILSPLEARMQPFDRVILGGLNEGSWPADILSDPWFNRPMRTSLGLPAPERVTGLAAHDFSIQLGAPEVFLTRSEKAQGQQTTPARWLVKLGVLLQPLGGPDMLRDKRWQAWAAKLDAPPAVIPCAPPEPKPPVSARPKSLSVTQVEIWLRDPYSLYASQILNLRALDAIAQEPCASDFGTLVHQAMEAFVKAYPVHLPSAPYDTLLEYGRNALRPLVWNAAVEALWWPKFKRIAEWVVRQETLRRPALDAIGAEEKGVRPFSDFMLTGRADRIERKKDGALTVIDYKTGAVPAMKDIEWGIASQLVLLASIFSTEGKPIASLEYWRLLGGKIPGEIKKPVMEGDIAALRESAEEGLRKLIAQYNNPDFPYRATPIPAYAKRYNDFEHLARVKEWR